jgi:hypothetical protein
MGTRPEHAQVTEPQLLCDKSLVVERDARCPGQRHSAARRGGDKVVRRGKEARLGRVLRIAEER